jgi:radical SAM protein with 4Fe4S-binding SPASM domain
MAVQSNGDIKGCLFLLDDSFTEGNVKEDTLEEIWLRKDSFPYNRLFTPSKLEGPCARCEHGRTCRGGCRALAFSTHGHVRQTGFCLYAEEQGWLEER